jgi:hypothetical protein
MHYRLQQKSVSGTRHDSKRILALQSSQNFPRTTRDIFVSPFLPDDANEVHLLHSEECYTHPINEVHRYVLPPPGLPRRYLPSPEKRVEQLAAGRP